MPVRVIPDRVQETTATTGTGTINLAGPAAQCQSFINAVGDGNQCDYVLLSGDGTNWETGTTVVHAGSPVTLTRDIVISSTNAGAKISLSGTSTVFSAATEATLYGRYGRRPTRPALSTFTWQNQGIATAVDYVNGPLTMITGVIGTDQLRALTQTPPAAPWTATAEFEGLFPTNTSFNDAGLILIDNAGKVIIHFYQLGTSSNSQLIVNWYNSLTSFNANKLGLAINPMTRYWLRVHSDGVNFTFYVSHNGADWVQVFQQGVTAFLSATISSVGIFIAASTVATVNLAVSFWSFELASGNGSNVQWV